MATSVDAPAITKLAAGPAAAIKNSAFALGGSLVRFATPPSRNSVIDETDILKRSATMACASSCSRTAAKNRNAATAETMKVFCCDHWGYDAGKTWSASDSRTRKKINSHEMCTRRSEEHTSELQSQSNL